MSGAPEGASGADGRHVASREVIVRAARPDDLPRLWELVVGLADYERMRDRVSGTPERLGALLFGEPGGLEALVAEREGRLVGHALFYPTFSSFRTARLLWLEDLFVDPEHRGSGAGLALLAGVARLALARGCLRVDWFVLDWNALAIDFYQRVGGRRVDVDWLTYSLEGDALSGLAARAR